MNKSRCESRRWKLSASWSQSRLAGKVGASRLWPGPFEKSKEALELGLVLKTLRDLDLRLDAMRWKEWALEEDLLMPEGVVEIVRITVHRILESIDSLIDRFLGNLHLQEHDSLLIGNLADAIKSRASRCAELME